MNASETPFPFSMLLPTPKRLSISGGVTRITSHARSQMDCRDPRVAGACRRMLAGLPAGTQDGRGAGLSVGDSVGDAVGDVVGGVRVVEDTAAVPQAQGYRLSVNSDGALVAGGSAAGCFYGLQTLGQLARLGSGEVPCCEIVDEPDLKTRGLLYDITRGKVPTLETLKLIAERLASLKGNQLQLNIEHAFVFSFDLDICDARHGITTDEVRELDAYCGDRFIDLVPALANLGHMGRILSMPRYRHLAEIETTTTWAQMDWPQRLRGLTLDVTNPEAHELVERMWSDVLDAFPSSVVNICGDEPWDLGQGKNAGRIPPEKIGETYVEHVRRVADFCASRGRSCQAWSDVVGNHPQLFHRLPPNLTILHWGYDDKADYSGTARFVRAGLDTAVCPGTSGWKRIINAMGLAERNISTFAAAARGNGATGLLTTDWGDLGHFNQLACSWHGMALGAACGWDADHPTGLDFDTRFAQMLWCSPDPAPARLLRDLSSACGDGETWRLLHCAENEALEDPALPAVEKVGFIREAAGGARAWFEREPSSSSSVAQDFRELAVAARFAELFADRVTLLRCAGGLDEDKYKEALRETFRLYGELWITRNKPAGLGDIAAALGV